MEWLDLVAAQQVPVLIGRRSVEYGWRFFVLVDLKELGILYFIQVFQSVASALHILHNSPLKPEFGCQPVFVWWLITG